MRTLLRSGRQFRSVFWQLRYDNSILSATEEGLHNFSNLRFWPLSSDGGICKCTQPYYMISRAPLHFNGAGKEENGEAKRAGPLIEYERRIGAGELMDGDSCHVRYHINPASSVFSIGGGIDWDTNFCSPFKPIINYYLLSPDRNFKTTQRLYDELVDSSDACRLDRYAAPEKASRSRWLWSRFIPQSSHVPVLGLYLYGGVGTGKTMLMDLFFSQLPSSWRRKRIHFHDFMLDVQIRLQKHRGVPDPLEAVAKEISDESVLFCLDEFMVTDVAIALILNQLFAHLFSDGVILIATSNRAPDKLYEGGPGKRDIFVPFISCLKERCVVHEIGSAVDYRKMTSAELGFYYVGANSSALLKDKFGELIRNHIAQPQEVELVMGRRLLVPLGAKGCAYFPFSELCDQPLGAANYFGLFKRFHTLALDGLPVFGLHNRNAAYRFVTLIDVMYDNKGRLLCSAEGTPHELLCRIVTISEAQHIAPTTSSGSRRNDGVDLCVDNKLAFAKDRTISRLTEMNSKEYLEQHASTFAEICP